MNKDLKPGVQSGKVKPGAKKTVAAKEIHSINAKTFIAQLKTFQSAVEREKIQRYFTSAPDAYNSDDEFIGVRMGQVFALAKLFMDMPLDEIEKLLESPIHEARAGAVSMMDFQARSKKTSSEKKKALFDLYIRRHNSINNWDLVDRSAPFVIGAYLFDKPRDILYKLARSKNPWERRTSIVSTWYFIRKGDVADTFKIAEILRNDPHDLVNKATGSWLRTAGGKDLPALLQFLDKYGETMPRTMLRYAIEHLDKKQRAYYMALKKKTG